MNVHIQIFAQQKHRLELGSAHLRSLATISQQPPCPQRSCLHKPVCLRARWVLRGKNSSTVLAEPRRLVGRDETPRSQAGEEILQQSCGSHPALHDGNQQRTKAE